MLVAVITIRAAEGCSLIAQTLCCIDRANYLFNRLGRCSGGGQTRGLRRRRALSTPRSEAPLLEMSCRAVRFGSRSTADILSRGSSCCTKAWTRC